MSNFDFIKDTWPAIQADCARAESYLASDPRSACFYARRSAEQIVVHLYDVAQLAPPYKDDLAARVNEPAFRNLVGMGIAQKLNLIRKLGNLAVHESRPIPPRAATDALRELFHVVVWTAFRYSTNPQAVPTGAQFDPALAGRSAPLTRDDVTKLRLVTSRPGPPAVAQGRERHRPD